MREESCENADAAALEESVAHAMTEIAFAEFPTLKNMSAEQIFEFGEAVNQLSSNFVQRVEKVARAIEAEK
ncbi:MAG: hypothetical protein ABIQ35_03180 [Verrucomicrobiota bacterium]